MENIQVKTGKFVRDARREWLKIDGVTLGESHRFGLSTTTSKDIGAILDKMIKDPKVVAVVYNWKTGQAFMKSGLDLTDPTDSKINNDYTTFVVEARSTPQKPTIQPTTPDQKPGFLTIDGDNLALNGQKFVAVGPNAYWLGYTENYDYPSKERIEEMFIATSRLSGNTIRSHTLGHSSGSQNSLRPFDNNLNEKAWDSIDYSFSMARKYNIKIIAPLTDSYSWYNGSYGDFCKTRGIKKEDFWTNQDVRNDFKDYINKYLNHYNPYNKCMIKDDPALGMIELGNELGNIREGSANSTTIPTFDWLNDISKYIKSIDKNHLILNPGDECLGQSNEYSIPEIDCFGAHFYWGDYNRLDNGVKTTRDYSKPYIVGEYSSFSDEKWYRDLESRNVKGSLFWSMYPHANGIFGGDKIPHNDGFTIHFSQDNEKHLLNIARHFCRLRGISEVNSIDFGKYVPEIAPVVVVPVTVPSKSDVWSSGKIYKIGDIVSRDSVKYTCLAQHTSEHPPEVVLWRTTAVTPVNPPSVISVNPPSVISVNPPGVQAWSSDKNYKIGDIVSHNGKNYSCIQSHVSNIGWMPNLTLLVLWNQTATVSEVKPNVPETLPSQPNVPVSVSSQPNVPVSVSSPSIGRLQKLLNGKSPIGTYYQSWSAPWASSGESHELSKISSPVNIVYLSFCTADCTYQKGSNSFNGTGLQFSSDFNVVKKAVEILKSKGVVVMLSVGGASYPFNVYNAKNVADLSNDLGCHGIDIDWEDEHGFERFGGLISSTRDALPNGCISTAGFSVGAYGQGDFTSAKPPSSRTGMNIQGLKSNGHQLDWINIMSYDASPVFDPIESFKAYRSFYKGPLLIGGEVPPEAWGGNVITPDAVKKQSEYVKSQGPENGFFTWSYQKQGTPSSVQILDIAYSILSNQVTPVAVPKTPIVTETFPVVNQNKNSNKTILAPYCYSWSKYHPTTYKIPTLVDGFKKIGLRAATFAFVTSDGGNNLSATVDENISDMTEFVKLGGNLIISCGGASSPWIEATMTVERMVETLGDLLTKTGSRSIDLDVEGTALHNVADYIKLNKAVAQLQRNFPELYVSYTIPVNDPVWGASIEAPALALLKNAVSAGVNITVVNGMLMDLYGDYSKRPRWGNLAINIAENMKKTLATLLPSRSEAEIYRTIGLCPMIGFQDDLSVFDIDDAKILARYAREKNVGLFTFWALQRDQIGNENLSLHSKVNKIDFEFYNAIKEILDN